MKNRGVPNRRLPDFLDSFESERLIIRAPKLEDAKGSLGMRFVNHYRHFRSGCHGHSLHRNWSMTKENLRKAIAQFITREDLRFHLYHKETGEFVGSSGLHRIDWSIPKFEIGYWLSTEF